MTATSTFGCPHCGKPNPLSATFCRACGAYLLGLDAGELTRKSNPTADDEPVFQPDNDAPARPPDPAQTQPWLRPDFDQPDPPAPASRPSPVDDQPWLRAGRDAQPTDPPPTAAPQRLVGGLQGLIEPIEIDQALFRSETTAPAASALDDLPYETRRELRQLFAADVPILEDPAQENRPPGQSGGQGRGLWRRNWIYGLLLVALLLGLWFASAAPDSRPHSWPGVSAAYRAIDSLPAGAVVLVNWAYDPSNAGEMDLAALPVIEHLLEKGARLLVVSQVPGGPATARRLIGVARAGASQAALSRQLGDTVVEGGYLPGGVASLPLLGQAPAQSVPVDMQGRSVNNRAAIKTLATDRPALLLVLAARSEDVQRWIEQVQTLDAAPIVAVTGAAVDPVIRPYVDSGQIAGLVSGYAGGIEYRALTADVLNRADQEGQRRHITGQNWALVVLLLVVAVGSLAGLAERREP
ncbi:MAG: zinc ribbon domain-containing protein [Chloroflexi bacterium]|nr:MAG: zinc ribbon domain-containing protein [Chloroflexota bacterium]